jgi:hypothetical protein
MVAGYLPTLSDDLTGGVSAQDSLRLLVYCVGTDPLKYGGQDHYTITVTGYPELPKRPDSYGSKNYADEIVEWGSYRDKKWMPQYEAAIRSRDNALREITEMVLVDDQWSGVQATTSALARVIPAGCPVLVASDLENTAPIAYDGSLADSRIFIIQPYISGDAEYAHRLRADYKDYLIEMGAAESSVTVYSADEAEQAFEDVLSAAVRAEVGAPSIPVAQQQPIQEASKGFDPDLRTLVVPGVILVVVIASIVLLIVFLVSAVRRNDCRQNRQAADRCATNRPSDYGITGYDL